MNDLSNDAQELKNAYYRLWRKNHPKKVKEYQSSYWERKAAGLTDDSKRQCQNNADINCDVLQPKKMRNDEIILRQKNIKNAALSNTDWIHENCQVLNIERVEVLKLLNDFLFLIFTQEDFYKSFSKIKRHFYNWSEVEIQKKQAGQLGGMHILK